MRGWSPDRRLTRLSANDLLGSLGGRYRVYWSHVRSVRRVISSLSRSPLRRRSATTGTSRRVSPDVPSGSPSVRDPDVRSPTSVLRREKSCPGDSCRFRATSTSASGGSSASMRAILKSVFPVREPRASLVILRVSLNPPKDEPFVIYTYIRIRGILVAAGRTRPGPVGHVPLLFFLQGASSLRADPN